MTCKDCIHHDVCAVVRVNGDDRVLKNSPCNHFIDKSRYIKLPCKVGDLVKYNYKGAERLWKVSAIHFYAEGQPQITITSGIVTSTMVLSEFLIDFVLAREEGGNSQ